MGLASVTYNGVQAHLKFDSLLLRFSPTSHPIQPHKLDTLHIYHLHNYKFYSVSQNRRGQYSPIVCSKGTQPEDDLSTSESECRSSRSHDEVNNVSTSHTSSCVDSSEKQIEPHETHASSIKTVVFWVCSAVVFGLVVGMKEGVGKAWEFFAGYILEQSLSVDNLFVFVLIFKYFKVPITYQNRVLSYGISGAVIFRLSFILLGTATLQRFEAVNLLLAVILLYSSFKLFTSEDDDSDLSNNFIVKTCQRFIPVTTYYDGNRFFTNEDGIWKE